MTVLTPDRHRPRVLVAAAAVGLVLVVILTAVGAPATVRTLLCLPLLIGISGAAFSAVLVPDQRRLDGLSRLGVVLLLGLGLLVAAGLLVATLLRDGLPATRVVIAQALLTAVPLGVLALRSTATTPSGPRTSIPGPTLWSGVAGVVLLVGALLLGTRLIPDQPASPTFAFSGPAATAPGPTKAAPGEPVMLGWTLRDAGNLPGAPTLQAVIDGRPAQVSTTTTDARPAEYAGTVTVSPPPEAGVHRVVLAAVLPSQRLELVSYIQVEPTGR